jgi:hypothetical protein
MELRLTRPIVRVARRMVKPIFFLLTVVSSNNQGTNEARRTLLDAYWLIRPSLILQSGAQPSHSISVLRGHILDHGFPLLASQ